jgi:hypothetical protein
VGGRGGRARVWDCVVERGDPINRLAFEVALGLVLLAALGLTRLVVRLRKY